MKVVEITVSAGRVIPHPFQQYANLRPTITLRAELEPGEDATEAARSLQAKAEGLVEDHSRYMVKSLEEIEDLTRRQAKVASLEASIRRAQADLDSLRGEMPALADLSVKEPQEPRTYAGSYDPSDDGTDDRDDQADRW